MELIVLSKENTSESMRYYGGLSCGKLGVVYNGENYMLKFPGNLKERPLKNVEISYSCSSTSEYLGSEIYKSVGIDVHDTFLAKYGDKTVVACKDFLGDDERLVEFSQLKTSMPVYDDNGDPVSGSSTDLEETLEVIQKHKAFEGFREDMMSRFWDMFIIDALIGNPDRNNGNFGLIVNKKSFRLAPVYDNGSCFHFRLSDNQLADIISNKEELNRHAFNARVCVFTRNGNRLNPYQLITSHQYADCDAAVKRLLPKIDLSALAAIIKDCPEISDIRKDFCIKVLQLRKENIIDLALQNMPSCEKSALSEKLAKASEVVKAQEAKAEMKTKDKNLQR